MKVKIIRTSEFAKLPEKKHEDDFCYDVYATSNGVPCKDDDGNEIPGTLSYETDLKFEIVRNEEVIVDAANKHYLPELLLDFKKSPIKLSIDARPRSSIYKTGLSLCNCEGTVDEPYRGKFKVNFYDIIPSLPKYKIGDRICQIKLGFTLPMEFVEVEELSETVRGEDGFGSTGMGALEPPVEDKSKGKKKGAKK